MNIGDNIGTLKAKLKDLADVINAFKSEAVQLKVLELLIAGKSSTDESPGTTARLVTGRRKKTKQADELSSKASKAKPERSSAGRGAFAIVSSLVTDGFFKSPRTIRHVIDHSGTQKGHHFKANEVSPALLRLLRNGTLIRKKNKDNQYEYSQ